MPYSKQELKRLKEAMDASYEDLAPFRESSYESIERYVGSRYGAKNGERRAQIPINLIQLATLIWVQNICPVTPRFLCTSKRMGLDRGSDLLELGLNHTAEEIGLGDNYKEGALNAIFSMGIYKTGTAGMDRGTKIDASQPYAEVVSIHNWVHDTNATRYENCAFAGDRVFLDYEDFKECGLYQNTDKVKPYKNQDDWDSDAFDPKELSGAVDRKDAFRDVVAVWEVYLPGDGKIITIPADGEVCLLREIDATRETGPYDILSLQDVPDNIVPIPPAQTWQDIHDLANDIMVKLANQSKRQKTLMAYQYNAKDDAIRVKNASDGDMIGVSDVSGLKEINFGGPDPASQGMLAQSRDLFNYISGNIDSIGGLSASADTLGQEQMMGVNSGQRMADLRERSIKCLKSIGKGIADELWNDPDVDLPLVKSYPSGIKIPMRFNQDEKEGDFLDYNVEFDVYSLTNRTPQEKIQITSRLMQEFILPLMPMIQQQGGTINTEELCNMLGDYANMPEFKKLFVFSDMAPGDEDQPIEPGKGNKTTREYIRRNVPTGGTRASRDNVIAQIGMGGNPQQSQRDSLNRVGV